MAGAGIAGVFNIIGGVFGALGLVSFATSFVPKPPPAVTQLTVAIGQTAETVAIDPDNLAGNIPAVKVFSLDGRLVGEDYGNGKKQWAAGSFNDVPMKNTKNAQIVQSEYVAIYATGTNAICISAIGLKNPNDETSFRFMGDVGKTCGMPWHISETAVGSASDSTVYRSPCIWITGENSKNKIGTMGFSFHIVDFSQITDGRRTQYEARHDSMCNSTPRFQAWSWISQDIWPPFFIPGVQYNTTNSTDLDINAVLIPGLDRTDYGYIIIDATGKLRHAIKYSPPPAQGSKLKQRSEGAETYSFGGTLIITPHGEHSARELCDSDTSIGPDVVSLNQGLLCDMQYKQLWPLCSSNTTNPCFDLQTRGFRSNSAKIRRNTPQKTYTDVKVWGRTSSD